MKGRVTIGLIGDRNDSVPAHQAIPLALENAAETLGIAAAYSQPRSNIAAACCHQSVSGPAQAWSGMARQASRVALPARTLRDSVKTLIAACTALPTMPAGFISFGGFGRPLMYSNQYCLRQRR